MKSSFAAFVKSLQKHQYQISFTFDRFGRISQLEYRHLIAGSISDIWQSWNNFCRDVVIKSCKGCVTRTGVIIDPRATDNSINRIRYEAKQAAYGRPVTAGKVISTFRDEPTWGDKDKIIDIINGVRPKNHSTLITGFGLPNMGPKYLQKIRNTVAHLNPETMNEIRSMLRMYPYTEIKNPIDACRLVNPTSTLYSIFEWMDDMRIISEEVTR